MDGAVSGSEAAATTAGESPALQSQTIFEEALNYGEKI